VSAQPGQPRNLVEQLPPVGTPVRGIGQRDAVGRCPLDSGDLSEHVTQQRAHEGGHLIRSSAENDRGGVTQPSFEFAFHTIRLAQRAPLRGLAEDENRSLVEIHDRWSDHRLTAERAHLGAAVSGDRGSHERGPQINT
jgi:hypothetical protein